MGYRLSNSPELKHLHTHLLPLYPSEPWVLIESQIAEQLKLMCAEALALAVETDSDLGKAEGLE